MDLFGLKFYGLFKNFEISQFHVQAFAIHCQIHFCLSLDYLPYDEIQVMILGPAKVHLVTELFIKSLF